MKSSSINPLMHLFRQKLNFVSSVAVALLAISQSAWADQTKADNTTALNAGGSWVSGTVPGSTDTAIWDSTVTGANNPALGGTMTWTNIQILNPNGLVTIGTNDNNNLHLASSGTAIDMSAATADLTFNLQAGSGRVYIDRSQTWNVASGRTLTLGNAGLSGGSSSKYGFNANNLTLTLLGGGTVVLGQNDGSGGGIIVVSTNTTLKAGNHAYSQNVSTININNGGVFDLNGVNSDSASPIINLNGTGISGNGAMINSSATQATVGGPSFNLQSSVTINCSAGNIRIDKTITETTGPNSLTKTGTNSLLISSANYTGATIINAGTLAWRGGR